MREMTAQMTISLSNPRHQAESAGVTGHKMLKMPAIAEYIAASRLLNQQQSGFDSQRLIKEFGLLAHSNVQDLTRLDEDGNLQVDFSNATRDHLAAVSAVKTKTRTIYDNKGQVVGVEKQAEFKLWDKIRAGELLGKHHGMFKEADTRVVVDVADRLLTARQRVLGGSTIEHGAREED
jgi:hypothetical protein